jgi:hypothetical protein
MSVFHQWDRRQIAGGGDKLTLRDDHGFVVGTLIRLPATVTRVFWPGGTWSDYRRWDDAVLAVERRAGLEPPAGSLELEARP